MPGVHRSYVTIGDLVHEVIYDPKAKTKTWFTLGCQDGIAYWAAPYVVRTKEESITCLGCIARESTTPSTSGTV